MTEAFITPSMLRWARERSFDTVAAAAEKLNVTVGKLQAWEQGDARPTFRKAQDLAKKLRIPFGYLYLAKEPDEALPLPDLRTKSGTIPRKPSPDCLEVLYDALRKQEWYHDYLTNEQVDNVPFVGRFTNTSPVADIAADIRRTLRLDDSLRRGARDRDDFFIQLVQRAEDAGVLVMRSGIVGSNTHRPLDRDEFQGFAISDTVAPLVFVNQNDFKAAQIFTLAHELAHIWVRVSGVCDVAYLASPADYTNDSGRTTDTVDADAVAAETLVPADTFELRWDESTDIDENLRSLSTYYRVSMFVILRRAYDLSLIDLDTFRAKYAELSVRTLSSKKGGGGGYSSLVSRNSQMVTTALVFSLLEGRVSPKEASALLNIRISKLPALAKYLSLRAREHA